MIRLSAIMLLCSFLQDIPDQNKDWLNKRVYPAHGGMINMFLPDGSEVEWPYMSGTALGKKGLFVEIRHKKVIGRARMQEVIHEDRAIDYFQSRVEDEPDKFFWKLMHALVLVDLDADDAIKHFDKYVKDNPTYQLLSLRACYHIKRYRYEEAMTDLDDALFLAPSITAQVKNGSFDSDFELEKKWYADAFLRRAKLWERLNKIDKAKADCEASLKLKPNLAYSYELLSTLSFDQKQYEVALSQINQAINRNEDVPSLYLKRAVILLAQNKVKEAQEDLPNCLNRTDLDAFDLLEAAWLLATHPNDAIRNGKISLTLAQRALAMNRAKDKIYLATLAAAYAETADFDNAVKHQQEAMTSPYCQKYLKQVAELQLANYRQKKPYRWQTMQYQGFSMPGWK